MSEDVRCNAPRSRHLMASSGTEMTASRKLALPKWRGGSPSIRLRGLFLFLAGSIGLIQPLGALLPLPLGAAELEEAEDLDETPISASDRDHWAYRPLVAPPLPSLPENGSEASPIDQFLQAERIRRGARPVPEASREVLLRRLTLTLTGIPPTPEQREDFLSDEAPDAYERLVDRLLASPRFGQRWGQFWLDLARFAETDGFEFDAIRSQAWKYRDWVIDAANRDLGYDQFLRQQLAGDELFGNDSPEALATAFCLSGPDMPDINSQEERRHNLLNELTGTVGAVFLATQIGCAQCHEHRFDPISQADFFRLRAFFESSIPLTRNRSILHLQTPTAEDVLTTHVAIRGDWRRPGPEVQPGFPRVVARPDETYRPGADEGKGLRTALADWLVDRDHPLTARVIANRVWQFHFGRGLCSTPSDFGLAGYDPSHPELLDYLAVTLRDHDWSLKRLHREILLSDAFRQSSYLDKQVDRNPEVVSSQDASSQDTSSDTGSSNAKNSPTKKFHAKNSLAENWRHNLELDPGNRWYTRYERRRLEGEVIRDSMLSVSGMLDERMGGPGVRPPLPEELRGTLLKGQWDITEDRSEHFRSSIYVFARRNLRFPIFEVFDRPDPNQSCARRYASTTAPQALLLLNSEFSWQMAEKLAERTWGECPEPVADSDEIAAVPAATAIDATNANDATDVELAVTAVGARRESHVDDRQRDERAVRLAMQLAWGRSPQGEEVNEALRFLENRLADHSQDESPDRLDQSLHHARTQLCLAILNASEFLYLD
jgi:hypothetical protein